MLNIINNYSDRFFICLTLNSVRDDEHQGYFSLKQVLREKILKI